MMLRRQSGRTRVREFAATLALISWLSFNAQAGQSNGAAGYQVEGTVRDPSGAPVPHAEVVINAGNLRQATATDSDGSFAFRGIPAETGTVIVRVEGFTTLERKWKAQGDSATRLEIILSPELLMERVTVTASRREEPLRDVAASVRVLTPENLSTTAALALDDALRQVPGFTLFRRSGSLTANPTSQGVSLRGVGASGASRALVLEDGVPLNDPFGGWVYWDRVPRESVGSIEVMQGGASDLYGDGALGGVVNFIPRRARDSSLRLETSYGNKQTPDGSLVTSLRQGAWIGTVTGEVLRTDGYVLVDDRERGAVETRAASRHATGGLMLERAISHQARAFGRASYFQESRKNGTPLQRNRTHLRQFAFGGDWPSLAVGLLSFRAYGGPQVFDQDFSAIALDRRSETLTRSQRVPAQQAGVSAQWARPAGSRHTLVAGLDGHEVRGASSELVFVSGRQSSAVGAGGRERAEALYGEDIFRITPRWKVTVGARFDHWRIYRALSTTRPLSKPGPALATLFPDRTEQAFSPRLSMLHQATENTSLSASVYRGFRAPTLNELYRSFRVGDVVTLSNDALHAERITGGEGGLRYSAFSQKLVFRSGFFWSKITRPIANVTLNVQPNLITRQRKNLGSTRSRGAEFNVDARISGTVVLSGGYQFLDSSVVSFQADPSLEGLLVPHVPRHAFTFQARYASPRGVTVGLQGRYGGVEFDDDQNQLRLYRYFTLDALVSRSLGHGVGAFAAAENLLNQRYDIGRIPVRTLGPPLLVRVGLRIELPPRR